MAVCAAEALRRRGGGDGDEVVEVRELLQPAVMSLARSVETARAWDYVQSSGSAVTSQPRPRNRRMHELLDGAASRGPPSWGSKRRRVCNAWHHCVTRSGEV